MTSPATAVRRQLARVDQRWHDLPLRTRLTSAAAFAATLAIVAVVAVAYVAVRHELRGQIDSQLRRQLSEVSVAGGFMQPRIEVNTRVGDIGGYSQVVNAAGEPGLGGNALPISAGDSMIARTGNGESLRDASFRDTHVRILTAPLPGVEGFAVQLALPLTDVDRQLHTLALAFFVLALAGLGLTVFGSWGVVRRTLRPVATLTDTAETIAATRDLTLRISSYGNDELGRLASTFNTMLDALERSAGAQRQLVMDASHELRTPLASLRTNVEVLGDLDRLDHQQRKAILDGIVSQLEELTVLVADVVELARGEVRQDNFEIVGLDELVETAVERARRHWPVLTFRCQTVPVQVRASPGRLDRAIANMLDNAGKFSPPGTIVDVELTNDGVLTVKDQGPGVPDEALPHVFDRFYRADEARAMPGSGLGLAIVKQVAENHGGSIDLVNRPGGGVIATLRLPVVEQPGRVGELSAGPVVTATAGADKSR